MADLHNDIELLIARHLAGETTAAEDIELESWIAESENNQKRFEACRRAFELSSAHYRQQQSEAAQDIDLDREWRVFTGRISSAGTVPLVPARNLWLRIAAGIIFVLGAGYAILQFLPSATSVQTLANTETMQLPDGSTIILNHHTSISYEDGFGTGHRQLILEGEAYFDVQPNKDLPFVIQVGDAEVQVVGTSFNVHGYSSSNEVEVTVTSGTVVMRAPDAGEVKLEAGRKGTLDKRVRTLAAAPNNNDNFLSWSTRRLEFSGTPLSQVVSDLRRAYPGTDIVLAPGVPDTCVITVTFDHQSLEAVLEVLKNTLNLSIRRTGDRIEITAAGC